MPDIAVAHVLTTNSETVLFNDPAQSASGHDQIYIQSMPGFVQAPLRVPQDDVPFGDGGLIHQSWKGARHVTVEGLFLIESTRKGNSIVAIRNQFEEDLRLALDDMIAPDSGTWVWTPQGQPERTLEFHSEVALDCPHAENWLVQTFSFGLVAAEPDWVEST
jgi:hypothetical protein